MGAALIMPCAAKRAAHATRATTPQVCAASRARLERHLASAIEALRAPLKSRDPAAAAQAWLRALAWRSAARAAFIAGRHAHNYTTKPKHVQNNPQNAGAACTPRLCSRAGAPWRRGGPAPWRRARPERAWRHVGGAGAAARCARRAARVCRRRRHGCGARRYAPFYALPQFCMAADCCRGQDTAHRTQTTHKNVQGAFTPALEADLKALADMLCLPAKDAAATRAGVAEGLYRRLLKEAVAAKAIDIAKSPAKARVCVWWDACTFFIEPETGSSQSGGQTNPHTRTRTHRSWETSCRAAASVPRLRWSCTSSCTATSWPR